MAAEPNARVPERRPRPSGRKRPRSPRRQPGRAVFTLLHCPGELVPVATDCRGGAPHRAPVPQRKAPAGATEAGSRRTRIEEAGIGGRATHPRPAADATGGGSATRVEPARPRLPQLRARARAAEGSRGGGAAARAPPPQTPKTSLNSRN